MFTLSLACPTRFYLTKFDTTKRLIGISEGYNALHCFWKAWSYVATFVLKNVQVFLQTNGVADKSYTDREVKS